MMRTYAVERGYPAGWQRPAGVQWRTIDPSTGLLLAAGCLPEYGSPADELFIEGSQPATTCPHRDFWSDLWGRLGGIFGGGRDDPDHEILGDDDELSGPPSRERRQEEIRREAEQRRRAIEDFLEQRARELSERARAERRRGG
jgi:hypothetical protein